MTHAFCQGKLLGGHVKFDVPLMTMDNLITYVRTLKPKKLAMPHIMSSHVYIYIYIYIYTYIYTYIYDYIYIYIYI